VNIVLRTAEIAFAAIVAGITGWILAKSTRHTLGFGRFVYTEIIAALTILVALLWLIPFSWSFEHWPFDFFMSVCWFVAFGLLVNVSSFSPAYTYSWPWCFFLCEGEAWGCESGGCQREG
ncbi:hypothetical protein IMZ48_41310, partial [Candidatus Bathyarchaeota archaeon]|nr:hypothetical protein [Candidatus Bathyarchaeota archaeon]